MSAAWRLVLFAVTINLTTLGALATALTPNDPYYAKYDWYAPRLGLPDAWGISQGSSSVVVAILDTGVISSTPDLAGRLLPAVTVTDFIPTDSVLMDSSDMRHGTWVASVAAMGVNNGMGGAGVGNFGILPVTVTDGWGYSTSESIAAGVRRAADLGAKAINISERTLNYSLVDAAAAYARTKGALVFMSAGNSDVRSAIADCPNLVFVSGTDSNDARWSNGGGAGSNWGPYITLAAPAKSILVADPSFVSGYGIGDGTSFSSPMAAGAAAMAWSINPNLTADEVLAMLKSTADDLGTPGYDETYGYGRINIGALAQAAYETTVPEPATLALLGAGGLYFLVWRTPWRRRV